MNKVHSNQEIGSQSDLFETFPDNQIPQDNNIESNIFDKIEVPDFSDSEYSKENQSNQNPNFIPTNNPATKTHSFSTEEKGFIKEYEEERQLTNSERTRSNLGAIDRVEIRDPELENQASTEPNKLPRYSPSSNAKNNFQSDTLKYQKTSEPDLINLPFDESSQEISSPQDRNPTMQMKITELVAQNTSKKKVSPEDPLQVKAGKEPVEIEPLESDKLLAKNTIENKKVGSADQDIEPKYALKKPIKKSIYNLQPKFNELMKAENVVEIFNLTKEFDLVGRTEKVRALSNINLNDSSDFYPVKRGEFVMIRGPSGGGKTTLLNIIGTADVASSGTLKIMGHEINEKSKDSYLSRLRLEKIGFVFQTFNLLATMTAYENVELPMKLLGKLSNKQIKQRTLELLGKVGLQDRVEHLPSELSGGEQQRVAIARALANTPEILLLDEPTGDLDTRSTVEIMNLLLNINNFGYSSEQTKCTMIMVTHNPDLECYADRILYIRDGKIVKQVINEVQTPIELSSYLKFLNINNQD